MAQAAVPRRVRSKDEKTKTKSLLFTKLWIKKGLEPKLNK
jgi:hypothetical protein